MNIFFSHSVSPKEFAIVCAIAEESVDKGVFPLIPDRNWECRKNIPVRISNQIKKANCIITIATKNGNYLPWVNKELSLAKKNQIDIIAMVDKNITVAKDIKKITIDRDNPIKSIREISQQIDEYKVNQESKKLLTWIGIGGLLFLLFGGEKK